MKPAALVLLVLAKLTACAVVAVAGWAEGTVRAHPAPASMSVLAEPLSGGSRRKPEDEVGWV